MCDRHRATSCGRVRDVEAVTSVMASNAKVIVFVPS